MLKITRKAETYLKSMILENNAIGIEIKVKNTGCSGKSYHLKYLNNKKHDLDDQIYEQNNILIKISKKNILYLKNIKIDLLESEFNNKIIFSNPNALEKCGCGESFKFRTNEKFKLQNNKHEF